MYNSKCCQNSRHYTSIHLQSHDTVFCIDPFISPAKHCWCLFWQLMIITKLWADWTAWQQKVEDTVNSAMETTLTMWKVGWTHLGTLLKTQYTRVNGGNVRVDGIYPTPVEWNMYTNINITLLMLKTFPSSTINWQYFESIQNMF